MIALQDVLAARELIAPHVRVTPVLQTGPSTWAKLEFTQHTGTFKARGAFARQLAALETGELDPTVGVVAASGGNAGLAHAFVARALGHRAEVYVPGNASPVKVRALQAAGAVVHAVGEQYQDAYNASQERVAATGALFCHAYDQPGILAGAGTLALELLDQVPDLDTVVVSVGGGGLLGGVLTALDGRARTVGVETEACPTLHAALAAGHPIDVTVGGIAAGSLGATRLGQLGWESAAASSTLRSVLVPDAAVAAARTQLWDRFRLATETGTAAAWAGLSHGAYVPAPGERVAVVLCGANTDPSDLA